MNYLLLNIKLLISLTYYKFSNNYLSRKFKIFFICVIIPGGGVFTILKVHHNKCGNIIQFMITLC
jgi:hypothetical protein